MILILKLDMSTTWLRKQGTTFKCGLDSKEISVIYIAFAFS